MLRNWNGLTEGACSLPAGAVDQLIVGGNLQVRVGTGNASILQFANQFHAAVTPASNNPIPEPSTFLLLGRGLLTLRRRA